MCAIIAYKGKKDAVSILKNRGCDSVRISLIDKNKKLHTTKQTGCIDDLEIPFNIKLLPR